MTFMMLLFSVVAVHGLSPHRALIPVDPGHRHRNTANAAHLPGNLTLAAIQTRVSRALAGTETGDPWADLQTQLESIKKRYQCEDATATVSAEEAAEECQGETAQLEGIAAEEAGKLASKTSECSGLDAQVVEKKAAQSATTKVKQDAEADIGVLRTRITTAETASGAAAANFAKERSETQTAIDLVERMRGMSDGLTLVELSNQIDTLADGAAKQMGMMALVAVKAENKGSDLGDLKELLAALISELDKYFQSLVDTEADRIKTAKSMKDSLDALVADQQKVANRAVATLAELATALENLDAAQTKCEGDKAVLRQSSADSEAAVTASKDTCTEGVKTAKVLGDERTTQLETVDALMKVLEEHTQLAEHVLNAVSGISGGSFGSGFVCDLGVWVASDWSTCGKTCGGAEQTRTVTCRTNNTASRGLDIQFCAIANIPVDMQACNEQPCCSGHGMRSEDDDACTCDGGYYSNGDDCSVCGSGCAECASESDCSKTLPNFFLSGNTPQACSKLGRYTGCSTLTACGGSTDAKCAATVNGYYVGANGNSKPCATGCARCTASGCSAALNNYFLSNGQPKPVRVCSGGQWEVSSPTPKSDRVCRAWTVCGPNQEMTKSPTATSDRQCKTKSNTGLVLDGSSRTVKTTCAKGDYRCQGKAFCEGITGLTCIYQTYDCATGSRGSWYPTGSPGGSTFNFAFAYDFYGGGTSGYGNICCLDRSYCSKYGIPQIHTNAGLGRWIRQ